MTWNRAAWSRSSATCACPCSSSTHPEDEVVPIASAERLYAMARQPKSLVALDRADHLLLEREDAEYAGRIIASWFGRYLS